jgi:hypothetical protein
LDAVDVAKRGHSKGPFGIMRCALEKGNDG